MTHEKQNLQPLLVAYLQGRDQPCHSCGYNLRNTKSDRCAECGSALLLELAGGKARLGAWSVAIVGITLPLVFAASMAIGAWRKAIFAWRSDESLGPKDIYELSVSTGIVLLCLLAARLMVWRSTYFLSKHAVRQWSTSLLWALCGIALLWLLSAVYLRRWNSVYIPF